ncbi:MAG: EVE domain-containing protein [Elusimicrobia bacterium]|nr:EVE domain-containing protein [Elusimicrobiota bacterium]
MTPRYWLMKSEPDVFSIDDLARRGTAGWDGVRNYQARNFMRAMKIGDQAFFYHSNARPPGVAGLMQVCREAYSDPTQFDPRDDHHEPRATRENPVWSQVDVRFVRKFSRLLPLDELRGVPALSELALFRRSRLSIQPVAPAQWAAVLVLAGLTPE